MQKRSMGLTLFLAVLSCAMVHAMASTASAVEEVDFNRDIRPILSNNCFFCHGFDEDERMADLRLDVEESATSKLKSGRTPIVPGDPTASELVRRINHKDADAVMPPPDSHKSLTPQQKELLTRWIAQGAKYEMHWAYVPPKMTEAPTVSNKQWPRHWIDNYILAALEAEGLDPAPEADRVTQIRRLYLDIIGLPPTPGQVNAFVNDKSPDAYEKVVDELLASPHFGERMAIWWLDLVRFADTVGYHGDQTHKIWPYRDYVINSFNNNKPFDQFTIEQLAGDLLDNPTQDQQVATAYNRLLQTTHEGGAQLKEYRAIYMADRIRNFSQVWMGATIGCAQCHNHKYDPYTIADFYALGAVFADVEDEEHLVNQYGGLNTLPTRRLPEMRVITEAERQLAVAIDAKIAAAQSNADKVRQSVLASQPQWEKEALASIEDLEPVDHIWVDEAQEPGGKTTGQWNYVEAPDHPVHAGRRSRLQQSGGNVQHYFIEAAQKMTVTPESTFYCWVYLDPDNPPKAIMLQFNDGSWEHRAVWGGDEISYGKQARNHPGYMRQGKLPAAGKWVRLEIDASKIGLKPGAVVHGMAFTQFGGRVYWDDAGMTSAAMPKNVLAALKVPADKRNDKHRKTIEDHYLAASEPWRAAERELAALKAQRADIEKNAPEVMVTKALAAPREVRLLPRGNWLDETGPIMQPAIPKFLGKIEVGDRRVNRLDVASWLVRPVDDGGSGELTARVQANRFWYLMMKVGIARVLDDFGGQGEPPVHPQLLDRLALEFTQSGWDVKHMIKTIAMTSTYRQSSVSSSFLREIDPDNRLYARQSRPRLDAEMVRDNALAVSGLLVEDIGGPSVNPYQPAGYYKHLNFPGRRYEQDNATNKQWRRGVYVHWQRQFLHPMMKAFDAQTREECVAQRPQSNTPTASLVLLNDPTFTEAAAAFAVRIMLEAPKDDAKRVIWAFEHATSREPSAGEVLVLRQLLEKHRQEFTKDPIAAAKVGTGGLYKVPDGLNKAELAAWMSVARTILNLNEVYTRN